MPDLFYILLIVLIPLAVFVLLGIGGRGTFARSAGIIGTSGMLVSAVSSLSLAYGYFFSWGKVDGIYQKLQPLKITWLQFTPELSIDMGIILDPVSVMMLVVISFVSLMVHVYSISYMKGEERYNIYFAFLSLFSFSMLALVMSSNIFQLYIFWELVGVSSFLLIGFYYQRQSAVAAAKKAFIVTRFADLGLLIGILILAFQFNTLDFPSILNCVQSNAIACTAKISSTAASGWQPLEWAMLLIFIGGAGKSALFPLHIWLPDAMEGPTPVSALIHAATMVVAGVFLVARLFPVYYFVTPDILELISWVGVFTALIAAIIACTQTDIKRVLAYSTMSQIGLMICALGVSGFGAEGLGFTASQFHLFTHAFFKALLFLCAGIIIHHVHSNELKDMGGLRKSMPVTNICVLIGCLAISGIPPFAGFFSKEEILLATFQKSKAVYSIALITSALTAFYMFRLYFSIFWNRNPTHESHTKEADGAELFPLIVLSVGAAVLGFVPFGKYLSTDGKYFETDFHLLFSIAPVVLAIGGIALAAWLYQKHSDRAEKISSSAGAVYRSAYHKFYIDEIYLFVTKKIIMNGIGKPAAWFDKNVINGLVNLTGNSTVATAQRIKKMQSGKVQQYGMVYLFTVIASVLIIIYFVNRN